jgi:hypothetical protein
MQEAVAVAHGMIPAVLAVPVLVELEPPILQLRQTEVTERPILVPVAAVVIKAATVPMAS